MLKTLRLVWGATLLLVAGNALALEETKYIRNWHTGKPDAITTLRYDTIPSGATNYLWSSGTSTTRIGVSTIVYVGNLSFSTPTATGAIIMFNRMGQICVGPDCLDTGHDPSSPNNKEMIHIADSSDAGGAAVETIIYNAGTGAARHTIQAGSNSFPYTATPRAMPTLIYIGVAGRASPGNWWSGGSQPPVANSAYIHAQWPDRFILMSEAGDNWFYTSVSSGSFRFVAGNHTTYDLLISSQGYISAPRNPCVISTATVQANATGDGTAYTLQFTTEIKDQAASFNAVSTFTAPIGGVYDFNACVLTVQLAAADHTGASVRLVTSNRTYVGDSVTDIPTGVTDLTLCVNTLADMEEGDTAYATLTVGGASKVVDVISGTFSGVLAN